MSRANVRKLPLRNIKFIIPNFLCFLPIVFPVKREGHFSPLLLFSVPCILFVASRRSLNETRHFRTLSAARGINISGQFYAVPSDFPDSRSTHTRLLGFSFFLSSLSSSLLFSFLFFSPLPRGNFLRARRARLLGGEVSFEIVERFGENRREISIAAFSLPRENYYRSSSKVLDVIIVIY